MFDIGFGEIVVLAVLALFVFGPEKLPKVAADAVKTLRDVRRMAANARDQLTEAVDPELQDIDLKGLDPREFVRRTLDEDDNPPARTGAPRSVQDRAARGDRSSRRTATPDAGPAAPTPATAPAPAPWDADAT